MERRRLQEEKEEEKEKIREGEAIKVGTFTPGLSSIRFLKALTLHTKFTMKGELTDG